MENEAYSKKIIMAALLGVIAVGSLYLIFTAKKPKPVIVKAQPPVKAQAPVPKPTVAKPKPAAARPKPRKMRFGYPMEIPGKVITLKQLTAESAFDYFSVFSADVRKFLEFPAKITYGYVDRYIRHEVERIKQGEMIAYNIWDNTDDKMVGSLQIREKNDLDPGQLGMWLNENYRGGGRIQEALFLISRAYFNRHREANNYIAFVRPWNPRSRRSMEKFGFKKTGDTVYDNGKAHILTLTRETIAKKALQQAHRSHPQRASSSQARP